MNNWLKLDLIHPACLLCGLPSPTRLCTGCRADLPLLAGNCRCCALPLPPLINAAGQDNHPPIRQQDTSGSALADLCPACRTNPPPISRLIAAFRYAFPIDALVRQMKFDGCLPVAGTLGELLAARVGEACGIGTHAGSATHALPHALIPIPLHLRRQRERGYNQAERIARPLSKSLQIPLRADALMRTRHTAAQSGMDLAARQQNLRDAFQVTTTLPGHVAIIDDVVTSGSTLHAVADVLLAAGVQRVDAWVVARTL